MTRWYFWVRYAIREISDQDATSRNFSFSLSSLIASFSFDYLLVIYRFEEGRPNELSLRGLRREWRVLCSIFVVRSMGCLLRPTPLTSRCVRDFNHNKLQYNLSDPRSPRQSSLNSFPSINALKHYDLSFFWFDIISLVIKDFVALIALLAFSRMTRTRIINKAAMRAVVLGGGRLGETVHAGMWLEAFVVLSTGWGQERGCWQSDTVSQIWSL